MQRHGAKQCPVSAEYEEIEKHVFGFKMYFVASADRLADELDVGV